ncbi:hypothetical protein OSB04_032204 [Centaurea solstitialis]|uniref:Uncharacterized protein n=1 Tax=Centaurea solstitialis TaxID=347529 RepID=A0AA38SN63_9ASTR|nr:hypothetical protein OSB04_032204 [Centaurea solstitialis]
MTNLTLTMSIRSSEDNNQENHNGPRLVCGVEALKAFSKHFRRPYEPSITRGTIEELELRVSRLQGQLRDVVSELEKARKGKQVL